MHKAIYKNDKAYDYEIFVNETTKIGLLRSYSFKMLHSHFKGKEFNVKKQQFGNKMLNINPKGLFSSFGSGNSTLPNL